MYKIKIQKCRNMHQVCKICADSLAHIQNQFTIRIVKFRKMYYKNFKIRKKPAISSINFQKLQSMR